MYKAERGCVFPLEMSVSIEGGGARPGAFRGWLGIKVVDHENALVLLYSE